MLPLRQIGFTLKTIALAALAVGLLIGIVVLASTGGFH